MNSNRLSVKTWLGELKKTSNKNSKKSLKLVIHSCIRSKYTARKPKEPQEDQSIQGSFRDKAKTTTTGKKELSVHPCSPCREGVGPAPLCWVNVQDLSKTEAVLDYGKCQWSKQQDTDKIGGYLPKILEGF